jgi:hypothetical protein
MANIFWRNLTSNNDANNINNYATTEGGTTVPGGTLADHTIYFSNTATSANWTLSANLTIGNLYTMAADTGGTGDYLGNLNINGKELTVSIFDVGGTDTSNKITLTMSTLNSKIIFKNIFFIVNAFISWGLSGTDDGSIIEFDGTASPG